MVWGYGNSLGIGMPIFLVDWSALNNVIELEGYCFFIDILV